MFNGYALLWSGDVLFYYGFAGLALFVFRNLSPRRLLILAAVFMFLQTMISVGEWNWTFTRPGACAGRDRPSARRATAWPTAIRKPSTLAPPCRPSFHPERENLEAYVANVREQLLIGLLPC